MTHSVDMKYEYYPETNIGGGPAGAAYACTVAGSADQLTPVSLPYNEDQTMPFIEYLQEALEAPGQAISTKTTMTTGIKYLDGKLVQHMQNGTWLDWALGIAPAEGGAGTVPKTFLLQWTNGLATYTSYGCYIKKYTLSGEPNKALKETIEFGHYKTEEEGPAFDAAWYDASTAVANFEDVGSTTITIEGNAITTLNSFELRIENEYSEGPHAGSYYHKYPYLMKRNVEIDMEFETDVYDEALDAIFATEAAVTTLTIVFTPLGKANFQADMMKVKNEATNFNIIPEKGIKKWKTTFEIGGVGAFTTP